MNILEWSCGTALFILAGLVLLSRGSRRPLTIIATIIFGCFLYLVFDRLSQFLTCDETYIFREIVSIKTTQMVQWSVYALRTTDIVVGTIIHVCRVITCLPFETYLMLAKIVHCLFGIGCLVAIEEIIRRKLFAGTAGTLFCCLFAILAGLLPINLYCLKLLNYDAISMGMGALGIVLLGFAFYCRQDKLFLLATAISFLAAQEKMIAGPILWSCILGYGSYLAIFQDNGGFPRTLLKFSKGCGAAFATALGMNLLSFAVLGANRFGHIPAQMLSLPQILAPFLSMMWPLLRMVGGHTLEHQRFMLPNAEWLSWCIVNVCLCAAVVLIAGIGAWFGLRLRSAFVKTGIGLAHLRRYVSLINYGVFLAVFASGAVAAYLLDARIAPLMPIGPGAYHPDNDFNGVIVHFGAQTMFGHYALSALWAYADFVLSLPTALVLVVFACAIMDFRRLFDGRPLVRIPLFFELILFACLLMPLLYGITQTPTSAKYLDLFVFLVSLTFAVKLTTAIVRHNHWSTTGIVAGLLILVLVEIAPYGPVFTYFRPLWYNYPKIFAPNPALDRLKIFWQGGGEEVMLAGKWIAGHEPNPKNGPQATRIYINYFGDWLGKKEGLKVFMLPYTDSDSLNYTSNDYFVIKKAGLLMGVAEYPWNVIPVHTLSVRGFSYAWIFRGDDLQSAGFRFSPRRIGIGWLNK